jgi:hypothetical protein
MSGMGEPEAQAMRMEDPLLVVLRDPDPDGALFVHLDPGQLAGGAEAGLILADIARHMAQALAAVGKAPDAAAALAEIRALWTAELDHPTQAVQGGLLT